MKSTTENTEWIYAVFKQHFTLYKAPETKVMISNLAKLLVYNFLYGANLIASQTDHPFTPFSEIIPDRLFLGMQASKFTSHPFFSEQSNGETSSVVKGLNVAVIESQELTGSFIGGKLLAECYWPRAIESNGIQHHWLSVADFTVEAHNELYASTIYRMYEFYQRHLPVYVHCKSGRGRSATLELVFLAYLLFKRDPELTEILLRHNDGYYDCLALYSTMLMTDGEEKELAIMALLERLESFIRSQRPIISVPESKRRKVLEVITLLFDKVQSKTDNFGAYSDDFQLVHDLGQSPVYKRISMYLADTSRCHSDAARILQGFFKNMVENKEGWYAELSDALLVKSDEEGVSGLGICAHSLPQTEYNDNNKLMRFGYLDHLKETLDKLLTKYPNSSFAKANVGQFIEQDNTDLLRFRNSK